MKKLLFLLFLLLISTNCFAATTLNVEVRDSAGDLTTVTAAEALFDFDITNETTTKVFSFDANSGTIPNETACTTDSGSTSGTCVIQTINNQILITGITGGTFDNDDIVTDGTNTVTLSNDGAGVDIDITIYDDGAFPSYWQSGTYDVDNNIYIKGDTASWDGTIANSISMSNRLFIQDDYVSVAYLTTTGGIKNDASGYSNLHHLIFNGSTYEENLNGNINLYNSLFINSTGTYAIRARSNTSKFYNITIINAEQYGYYSANSHSDYAKNIVACGSGTADFYITSTSNKDYLASCDGSADDYATNYLVDLTASEEFTNPASDFTLLETSNLIGIGLNLNSSFTDDLATTTRGGLWDIGAFQYATTPYVPITTAFDIPSFSRDFEIAITTWDTSVEVGEITGYCLEETGVQPAVDASCWVAEEPTTYTFDSNGKKTLYAWLKDGEGDISVALSDTTEIRNLVGLTYAFWANSGEDKVRQDEVRKLDEETTINEIWDGTTIRIKEGTNAFAQFSVYIEAGENTLTDVSVEMSDLVNGENTIDYGTRTTSQLFDFTLTDIELFYARYLQIRGIRQGYDEQHKSERQYPVDLQRPYTLTWKNSTMYHPGYYYATPNAGTLWADRPGADKYFPDILVPIELEPTFDISSGTSQQIWVDVWIAKNTPAGIYTGTLTVKDGEETLTTIPIELEVYDFELADSKQMKTWTWAPMADIIDRWMATRYPTYSEQSAETKSMMIDVFKNVQFIFRRHGVGSWADDTRTYCKTEFIDTVPSTGWLDWYGLLTGDLFSTANGYDGPMIEIPIEFYVIGFYGGWDSTTVSAGIFPVTTESFTGTGTNNLSASNYTAGTVTPEDMSYVVQIDSESETYKWSDDGGETWEETGVATSAVDTGKAYYTLDAYTTITWGGTTGHVNGDKWEWSSTSDAEAAALLQAVLDSCYVNLEAVSPGIIKMLYTIDEAYDTESKWDVVEKACRWGHASTGGGENIKMYSTSDINWGKALGHTGLDSAISHGLVRAYFNYNGIDGSKVNLDWWKASGKEAQRYIGPWDSAANASYIGWQLFKDEITVNFLWASALWINNERGYHRWNEKTDLFYQASTLGPGSAVTFSTTHGLSTKGNGHGNLFYPGTDLYYKEYTFDANSGTIPDFSLCTTDGGTTSANCTYQDNDRNVIRAWVAVGSFDDNDVVTDGTNSVTLTGESDYLDSNYGVNGIFASIRVKNYRKTVQDYEYLHMAQETCPSCVESIVSGLGFTFIDDQPVDWSNLAGYGQGYGWSTHTIDYGSIDDFERARAKLANIILGTNPPIEIKGFSGGGSF